MEECRVYGAVLRSSVGFLGSSAGVMLEDFLELSAHRKDVSWFPSINCKRNTASWQSFTFLFAYEFQREEFTIVPRKFAFRTGVLMNPILFSHLCKPGGSQDGIAHSNWCWFPTRVVLWSYFCISSPVLYFHELLVQGDAVFAEITTLVLCASEEGCRLQVS